METFDTDSKYTMAKIGMNENKAHVDEIHNIRSGLSVYISLVIACYHGRLTF